MRPIRIKSPTPAEYAVIASLASAVPIVLGVVGFVVARRAPVEEREAAAQLMGYSMISAGIGVFVALAFWLCRHLTR